MENVLEQEISLLNPVIHDVVFVRNEQRHKEVFLKREGKLTTPIENYYE